MEYEDVVNWNLSQYNETGEIYEDPRYYNLMHEILFGLCCTIAFFADIYIIYTILYFKKMRTVPNILIANWVFLDLFTLIVTPSGYQLLSILDHFEIPHKFYCVLFALGSASHYSLVLYVFVVLIDWILMVYLPNVSQLTRRYYKFLIGLTWTIAFILSVVYIKACASYFVLTNFFAIFITFLLMLITVIALQCIKVVQKCRGRIINYPTLSLNLVTAFVSCYALAIINAFLVQILRVHDQLYGTLGACTVFCNGIINLILLYLLDKDFKAHLLQVIRFNCKKYESQVNDDDNNFSVEVSFHKPTQKLLSNVY